jgi:hypothetical protein
VASMAVAEVDPGRSAVGGDNPSRGGLMPVVAHSSGFWARPRQMSRPVHVTGNDPAFPYQLRQDGFGWRFDSLRTYDVYRGSIDARNAATIAEDFAGGAPLIRMVVQHD